MKNGRTTLVGVVDNSADKQIAEVRAREVTGVFEVVERPDGQQEVTEGDDDDCSKLAPRSHAAAVIGLIVCALLPAARHGSGPGGDVPLAPELTGLGTLHMPVTTSVPRAQRFFDQGMRLLYAFNHAEAIRAFREAARLDPALAMAYWGQAMALGPNLNAPMTQENGRAAFAAIRQAMERMPRSSARERALIEALATRYAADGAGDRPALDRAYAAAMQKVAARFARRPGRRDALRRRADEHDAVGLLAEGRIAEAGRPPACSPRWSRSSRGTPTMQARFTITSICWRPPTIPIAPSEAPIGSAR